MTEDHRELLKSAAAAARDYALATQVDCAVLSDRGTIVFDTAAFSGVGNPVAPPGEALYSGQSCLCIRSWLKLAPNTACKNLHLYAATQAERFGGSYVYLCPIGMHYWSSPIYAGDAIAGILVGGPVRAIEQEEVLSEFFRHHGRVEPEAKVRSWLSGIPYVSTDRIRSLAELLTSTALRISPPMASALGDRQRSLDQQSRIAVAIHEIKSHESGGEPIPPYPIAKERELLDAIRRNDESNARRVLNELLGAVFFSSGHRFEVIKFRGLELLVLLSRAAAEAGAAVEEVLGLNYRFLKRFQELETQEDLALVLDTVLSRFSRLAFSLRSVKHASAIERALKHIKRRLHTSISLQEASDAAGLSPAYFSRVFKEEMKESFSEHLNRLRVEKASALLLSTNRPLTEIASQVGFEDQSYFTKVFKRLKGQSPGRYRTSGGRAGGENPEIHEEEQKG